MRKVSSCQGFQGSVTNENDWDLSPTPFLPRSPHAGSSLGTPGRYGFLDREALLVSSSHFSFSLARTDAGEAASMAPVTSPIAGIRFVNSRRLIRPSVSKRAPERRSYFFGREIARWAEFRSAPVMHGFPTHHDNDITLPNGMLIAGLLQGVNIDRLAHCLLEAHWRDDADLADSETLTRLGKTSGVDPAPLLEAALSPETQAVYASNTEEAINRSVFGSPTYFVDGDMFYGQDHLQMVERALQQPFAGRWPRP